MAAGGWRVLVTCASDGTVMVKEPCASEVEAQAFESRFIADMASSPSPCGALRIATERLETDGWAVVRARLLMTGGSE